jgi:hypothetical protein
LEPAHPDTAQPRLGDADAGDAGALVAEQELGVVPALVFLADDCSTGTSTSSRNTSLTSWPPSMVWIGRTVMPGVFMSTRMKEMPSASWPRVGAAQAEDPVGVLRQRGPGLLAVDDPAVALALGLGLERGEVRARARLGKALAPPVVDIGDARQKRFFCASLNRRCRSPGRPC